MPEEAPSRGPLSRTDTRSAPADRGAAGARTEPGPAAPSSGDVSTGAIGAARLLGREVAARILYEYEHYRDDFHSITRRAGARFRERDWRGAQDDATERLLLYGSALDRLLPRLAEDLGDWSEDPELWREAKDSYAHRAAGRPDAELALTFFNSVSRRALGTVGVDPATEFLCDDLPEGPAPPGHPRLRCYPIAETDAVGDAGRAGTVRPRVVRRALEDLPLAAQFDDPDRDARLVTDELNQRLSVGKPDGGSRSCLCLELLPVVFYRNKGAYAVGRIRTSSGVLPLVLPILNTPDGAVVDAVLTSSDEMSVVFGFSRSYFHVQTERPREMVAFLRSLMPRKRVDELYTSLGYNRHGKTELYRALRRHLEGPDARFEIAEGERGLVMSVFTLPGLNVVFKLIKDRFPPQKRVTTGQVKERYRLVFVRDRVGRLADAQEFEHLEFRRSRFSPRLLEQLRRDAPTTVSVDGDQVVIEHLYTVRQMTPLNVYLERAGPQEARAAIVDYGYAIKDLAAADIFPGDLLLKNFGVSRHGRVIFYDYDELTHLTDCRFRELPEARSPEDELAAEPWYYVAPNDLFPEEFKRFLGIPEELQGLFLEHHADLFEPEYWREMQARLQAGEVADFFPYPRQRRLRGDAPGGGRSD